LVPERVSGTWTVIAKQTARYCKILFLGHIHNNFLNCQALALGLFEQSLSSGIPPWGQGYGHRHEVSRMLSGRVRVQHLSGYFFGQGTHLMLVDIIYAPSYCWRWGVSYWIV